MQGIFIVHLESRGLNNRRVFFYVDGLQMEVQLDNNNDNDNDNDNDSIYSI